MFKYGYVEVNKEEREIITLNQKKHRHKNIKVRPMQWCGQGEVEALVSLFVCHKSKVKKGAKGMQSDM